MLKGVKESTCEVRACGNDNDVTREKGEEFGRKQLRLHSSFKLAKTWDEGGI